jgi:hypothetical protein
MQTTLMVDTRTDVQQFITQTCSNDEVVIL